MVSCSQVATAASRIDRPFRIITYHVVSPPFPYFYRITYTEFCDTGNFSTLCSIIYTMFALKRTMNRIEKYNSSKKKKKNGDDGIDNDDDDDDHRVVVVGGGNRSSSNNSSGSRCRSCEHRLTNRCDDCFSRSLKTILTNRDLSSVGISIEKLMIISNDRSTICLVFRYMNGPLIEVDVSYDKNLYALKGF